MDLWKRNGSLHVNSSELSTLVRNVEIGFVIVAGSGKELCTVRGFCGVDNTATPWTGGARVGNVGYPADATDFPLDKNMDGSCLDGQEIFSQFRTEVISTR
ncbi:hypothetical protein HNY73_017478 [Argiope bruennichi]|uniref:Uncharacterized protein n=1 Tax=Argiope bruennichi TaxID=94029 RepID=A0A8T0EB48_ARGBR|nr:hypothetical protein HNY73_017478 [Argiope bruennichi]